eukprot:1161140-Pelagomonas_calceolata.AAC.16
MLRSVFLVCAHARTHTHTHTHTHTYIHTHTHTQREATELAYNEKRSTKLLEAAEQALTFEKEEVTRLYSSLQELEKQVVQSTDRSFTCYIEKGTHTQTWITAV